MLTALFFIVDSFTKTRYAGNPAGVVLAETPLSEAQMLTLAGELHLETAFVSPSVSVEADYGVAYYTSAKRIPLCGHDTIALVTVLVQTGRLPAPAVVRLATDVGILQVQVEHDGKVTMAQALPHYGEILAAESVATALGLPIDEIGETGLPVQVVSTGSPFLIVPVAHRAALNALAPDMTTLAALSESLPDAPVGFYLWTPETESADAQIHARCFAPAAGLPEDPVTGTASGAVGAYLAHHGIFRADADGVIQFRTEQGFAMGRPGHAEVRLEMVGLEMVGRELSGPAFTRIQVSGYAVLVAEGRLWIE